MILNKQLHWLAGWSEVLGFSATAPLAAELPPAASAATIQVHFDAAMDEFEHCHWHEAFDRMAMLADHGHAEASRVALLMHSHGTRMFGGHFSADSMRLHRWLDAAVAGGVSTGE